MAQFPIRQAEVLEQIRSIAAGFAANPGIYPLPPVDPAELSASLEASVEAVSRATAALAEYKATLAAKDKQIAITVEQAKSCLRYAENTVNQDDDKLKLLGWSGRRQGRPTEEPGQVMYLTAAEQGDDWTTLRWKAPIDGGKPVVYQVQRWQKDQDEWVDAGVSLLTGIKLTNQPRLIDLQYRVVAINKAGQGPYSNTIEMVL